MHASPPRSRPSHRSHLRVRVRVRLRVSKCAAPARARSGRRRISCPRHSTAPRTGAAARSVGSLRGARGTGTRTRGVPLRTRVARRRQSVQGALGSGRLRRAKLSMQRARWAALTRARTRTRTRTQTRTRTLTLIACGRASREALHAKGKVGGHRVVPSPTEPG